ncbi:hypothetical protein BDZ91DRAFT_55004 [Kalaharituber pfeilii]|nr:hypothetical protein BDZ91DRAFT_55004 [Kalaharituber pfeilii]
MSGILRHAGALYTPADDHQPLDPSNSSAPRWSRELPRSFSSRPSTFRRRGNSSVSTAKKRSILAKARSRMIKLRRYARKQVNKMNWWQKILAGLFVIASISGAILVTVYHTELLAMMLPVSKKLTDWPAGWLIIWSVCYVSAFPPLFGYSTSVSLAGFVYGFPYGWYIVSSATVLGSTSAFLACRYYFRDFAQRMVATDKRFAALALTLKHDGLKLLCMIRLCPLPYSISNGAISTFPTVKPWAFMLATTLSTLKLMIHIFIGTRLRMLAEEGRKMDGKTKLINYGSLLGGVTLGIITGLVIYRRTVARAKQLEHEERAHLRASRTSTSSGRPSFADTLAPAHYTDIESDDEEAARERDPHAAQAAAIVGALVEGDELEEAGLFSEEDLTYDDDSDSGSAGTPGRDEEELLDVSRVSTDRR